MLKVFESYRTFFREASGSFRTVGAVAPSGRFLARAIASPMRDRNGPMRVLEVGPGTGALTWEIVRYIQPHDRLDVVELNGQFVESLASRFQREWRFRRVVDQTRILHCAIQEHVADQPYDYVISGLPLNSFPSRLVHEVFESFTRLLAPGGVLSFFQYLWVRDVTRVFRSRGERRRLSRIGNTIDRYLERFEFHRETVLANLPPALVHHLRMK